jgi:hypothetical protein
MGDVVNLRRARKARVRSAAEQQAAEARARHGRTGAERAADRSAQETLTRQVDNCFRERPHQD